MSSQGYMDRLYETWGLLAATKSIFLSQGDSAPNGITLRRYQVLCQSAQVSLNVYFNRVTVCTSQSWAKLLFQVARKHIQCLAFETSPSIFRILQRCVHKLNNVTIWTPILSSSSQFLRLSSSIRHKGKKNQSL